MGGRSFNSAGLTKLEHDEGLLWRLILARNGKELFVDLYGGGHTGSRVAAGCRPEAGETAGSDGREAFTDYRGHRESVRSRRVRSLGACARDPWRRTWNRTTYTRTIPTNHPT
jgi:hypothetical protein